MWYERFHLPNIIFFFEKKIYITQRNKSTKNYIHILQNLYTHNIVLYVISKSIGILQYCNPVPFYADRNRCTAVYWCRVIVHKHHEAINMAIILQLTTKSTHPVSS